MSALGGSRREGIPWGVVLALGLLGALLLPGCIFVPTPPATRLEAGAPFDSGSSVSAGPRRDLDSLSARIRKLDPRLVPVDRIAFRDAVFPEGGWKLSELRAPATSARAAELADYLILITPLDERPVSQATFMTFIVGFWGYMHYQREVVMTGAAFDLATGEPLHRLHSWSRGTSWGIGLIYGIFFLCDVRGGALESLARELGGLLLEAAPEGQIRFVALAVEPGAPGAIRLPGEERADTPIDGESVPPGPVERAENTERAEPAARARDPAEIPVAGRPISAPEAPPAAHSVDIRFALGRGTMSHRTRGSSLDGEADADSLRLQVEGFSHRGTGGGVRIEGQFSEDDIFEEAVGEGGEVSSLHLFVYAAQRLRGGRWRIPIRGGLLFHDLLVEDDVSGIEIDYFTGSLWAEAEPEFELVEMAHLRWSLYGRAGLGHGFTKVEADPSTADETTGAFSSALDLGTRLEAGPALLGLALILRRTEVIDSEDFFPVTNQFTGLELTVGLRW